MAATALTDRYAANLHGVLSCYDRIIITGTLPGACYAGGMTSFLYSRGIRIFDYARFAEPLRDRIRQRAQEVVQANGVLIEHVSKSHVRKEDLVARVLAQRGDAPGLVHVISAMESCQSFQPWLNKANGMGAAGVKVYDKFSRVLRIETTVNDVSFFKHHRKVEHNAAPATRELAPLKKSIYSLIDLREILLGCNQRYLAFLSSLDDPSAGERDLRRLSQPRVGADPSVKGLNFFSAADQVLLRTLQHGEFNIHGWRRGDLVTRLAITPWAMTRQLRRLRLLGLIKKVTHTYRYYLTRLGRAAIAAACSLTRFSIVPAMAVTH